MTTLIDLNNNSRYSDENQTEWHRRRLQKLEDKLFMFQLVV